jgi:proteasome alpha subunit
MRRRFKPGRDLTAALAVAVAALGSTGGPNGGVRTLPAAQLEVAVLDRNRPARTFRRITGAALTALLPAATADAAEPLPAPADTPPHDADSDPPPAPEGIAPIPGGRSSKPAANVQLPDDTSLGVEPGQQPPEPGIDPTPGPAPR